MIILRLQRLLAGRLDELLAGAVFPLLLLSVALNQPRDFPWLGASGRLVSVAGTVVAAVFLVRRLRHRAWPLGLLGVLLALRGSRFVAGDVEWLVLTYTIASVLLFSAVGAIISLEHGRVLRRQIAVLCLLSIPLMLAQILGFEWSQILRTDLESTSIARAGSTLFVGAAELVVGPLQSRPAGLAYANNVMSLIVLLALGVWFGRVDRVTLSWGDVAILAVVVLMMAKITLLGLCVVFVLRLLWGSGARAHTRRCVGALGVLLAIYGVAFPGLFVANLHLQLWVRNFQIRTADLLIASDVPALKHAAQALPADVLLQLSAIGASQSGYAALVQERGAWIPAAILSLPYLWLAGRRWQTWSTIVRRESLAVAIMLMLAPLITSAFGSVILWFLAGIALAPLWSIASLGVVDPSVASGVEGPRI